MRREFQLAVNSFTATRRTKSERTEKKCRASSTQQGYQQLTGFVGFLAAAVGVGVAAGEGKIAVVLFHGFG